MKELSSVQELIHCFEKLPSVGPKSAERMAYAVLSMPSAAKKEFGEAFFKCDEKVHRCPECGIYTEGDRCEICESENRDHHLMCVVASEKDVLAIEKMNTYNGIYHVLGGLLSASKNIGMDDLAFDSLLRRIKENDVYELIIATSPTLEGETTALFIAKLLEKQNVTTTRLGYGLPVGASLDYADSLTLSKAFEGRKKI